MRLPEQWLNYAAGDNGERKDCLWLWRTDQPHHTEEPNDAQMRRPRSISLTVKPQKLLESPLGALKSAELLWPELLAMLIYGGNSKPLQRANGA